MTPDWLATEDGRKMMEAYLGRPLTLECGRDVDHFIDSCRACLAIQEQEEISMRLGFALPHLDRMFRERYAAEATMLWNALAQYGKHQGHCPLSWNPSAAKATCACGLAVILRREPTL